MNDTEEIEEVSLLNDTRMLGCMKGEGKKNIHRHQRSSRYCTVHSIIQAIFKGKL